MPVAEKLPAGRAAAEILGRRVRRRRERSDPRRRRGRGAPRSSARRSKAAVEAETAQGRVLLVGAGPGDPELLTLKAVRALKAADVILYDRLVGDGRARTRPPRGRADPGRQGQGRPQRPARQRSSADDRARARRPDRGAAQGRRSVRVRPRRRGARRAARCRHRGRDRPGHHRRASPPPRPCRFRSPIATSRTA